MRAWASLALMLLVWVTGCKNSGTFSASTPTATPHSSSANSQDCAQYGGMTQATLATDKIKSGGNNQFLQYEVSLVACNGTVISLANKPVLFDIDAVLVPNIKPLPFVVTNDPQDSPAINMTGMLAIVPGTDLFGNSGPHFFHHATDTLNYGGDAKRIMFKIDLSGLTFVSLDGSYDGVHGSDYLATYLRIGTSLPLKMDVLFY